MHVDFSHRATPILIHFCYNVAMNCPICSTQTHAFVDERHGIEYRACMTCQYRFKSPQHHPDWTAQKQRYDLHQNNPDDPGYRAYFQRFLDFVLPHIPQKGSVLDFGSGASDLLSSMLREQGWDAMRYDPIYHPDTAYTHQHFDLIVSTEVFEHLDDPSGALSHLHGCLAPGGHLALQTQFYPIEEEAFLDWYYRLDPTHIGFFTPETFRWLASVYGMEYAGDDGTNKVVLRRR